jgi:hypothetical protein
VPGGKGDVEVPVRDSVPWPPVVDRPVDFDGADDVICVESRWRSVEVADVEVDVDVDVVNVSVGVVGRGRRR